MLVQHSGPDLYLRASRNIWMTSSRNPEMVLVWTGGFVMFALPEGFLFQLAKQAP